MRHAAILWAAMALVLSACAVQPRPQPTPVAAEAFPFKRGVNILGYDPFWKDPAKARFQWRHFGEIRRAGFDHVRVNLHAFDHMDASHRLSPQWLSQLDKVVSEAQAAGLGVILDEHNFTACAKDVPACRIRLSAFWRQVAPRYRNAPRNVAFELLNEPHEALDAETWNSFLADLLAIVRESNPTRIVVIGPTRWNNFRELPTLRLPEEDRNILVTFHYYDPFPFTHQGASWAGDVKNLSGIPWGSDKDREQLRSDFATVAAWGAANRRPIYLGEFGAYDKSGTPLEMRVAWTEAVAREAERNGFGWGYWQFDSDFVAWDMRRDAWFEPIRKALIPEE